MGERRMHARARERERVSETVRGGERKERVNGVFYTVDNCVLMAL